MMTCTETIWPSLTVSGRGAAFVAVNCRPANAVPAGAFPAVPARQVARLTVEGPLTFFNAQDTSWVKTWTICVRWICSLRTSTGVDGILPWEKLLCHSCWRPGQLMT